MTEPLPYRDGHESNVDPVLIDRRVDGSVRIVVNVPPVARQQARNRFLFASSLASAFLLAGKGSARSANLILTSAASFSFLGIAASAIFGILWLQSSWTYVFETSSKELCIERRGRFFSRRRSILRQRVRDIQIAKGRGGRAVALVIRATDRKLAGRYLEYLDENCLQQIATALRDGLAPGQAAEVK